LLKAGADVDFLDASGTTALHLAAQRGHDAVVRTILEAGANVNFSDAWGTTALHFAAQRGHDDIVRTLLRHGADVNAVDGAGNTPLSLALPSNHSSVIDLLRDRSEQGEATSNTHALQSQREPDDAEKDDEDQRMVDAPQSLNDTEESFSMDTPPSISAERHPKPAAETKHQNTSQARIPKRGSTWLHRNRQRPSEFIKGDMVVTDVRSGGKIMAVSFVIEDRKYSEDRQEWMYQLKSLYTGAVHERGRWFSESSLERE
jgi:hypothetical protein